MPNDIGISDYSIEIKEEVFEQLREYIQKDGCELCGVLTGSQIDEKTFRISKISPPCIASNSRCGCVRDAQKGNAFIAQDYEQSEHTRVYIGEWHTHPETNPTPSPTDISSIVSNYHSSTLILPVLVMVIVGTESLYVSVYEGNSFIKILNYCKYDNTRNS
ncbi:MAG: Mov34/MPN/PAD-1 family protein [Bacteroidales bacterium]|nr:Mov34/MPN/PAD-1 family protein [Bacteroidales bacterium]